MYNNAQTAKGAKISNAAVAATADGHHTGREGDEKIKMHTHSYCCLDYAQVLLCEDLMSLCLSTF